MNVNKWYLILVSCCKITKPQPQVASSLFASSFFNFSLTFYVIYSFTLHNILCLSVLLCQIRPGTLFWVKYCIRVKTSVQASNKCLEKVINNIVKWPCCMFNSASVMRTYTATLTQFNILQVFLCRAWVFCRNWMQSTWFFPTLTTNITKVMREQSILVYHCIISHIVRGMQVFSIIFESVSFQTPQDPNEVSEDIVGHSKLYLKEFVTETCM